MGVDAIDQTICPDVLGMTKCSIALMVIWKYMDRSVTKKILYGPKLLRSI